MIRQIVCFQLLFYFSEKHLSSFEGILTESHNGKKNMKNMNAKKSNQMKLSGITNESGYMHRL